MPVNDFLKGNPGKPAEEFPSQPTEPGENINWYVLSHKILSGLYNSDN